MIIKKHMYQALHVYHGSYIVITEINTQKTTNSPKCVTLLQKDPLCTKVDFEIKHIKVEKNFFDSI